MNKNLGFIILLGVVLIILFFLINYYDLMRFRKCYDNDFNLSYCTRYRNY